MALFENHSKDVRRIILIAITVFIGAVLLSLMYISHTSNPSENKSEASSKIKDFYNTISDKGQFIFDSK